MNRADQVEAAAPVPVRLFALATGMIVVSLYLPQPLVGQISTSLGLSPAAGGGVAIGSSFLLKLLIFVQITYRGRTQRTVWICVSVMGAPD